MEARPGIITQQLDASSSQDASNTAANGLERTVSQCAPASPFRVSAATCAPCSLLFAEIQSGRCPFVVVALAPPVINYAT